MVNKKITSPKSFSRRQIVATGAIAGAVGALASCGVQQTTTSPSPSSTPTPMASSLEAEKTNDIAILNAAIDLENQAIWAYGAAAGKLSKTKTGQTVLTLALRNRGDHEKHRDALAAAVKSLGGTPAAAKDSYDLSTYIKAGEGNLDSDANIAKLALALEYDAALAYIDAFNKLKIPALLAAAGTIAPAEASHATAIRAVFRTLIPTIEYVPAAFVSAEARKDWVLKV